MKFAAGKTLIQNLTLVDVDSQARIISAADKINSF